VPRAQISLPPTAVPLDPHSDAGVHGRTLRCTHCSHGLECVEQNRRSGTWVGSFICAHCRSEYLYAYRWGRLLKKD
jgi:hypothetical protein